MSVSFIFRYGASMANRMPLSWLRPEILTLGYEMLRLATLYRQNPAQLLP